MKKGERERGRKGENRQNPCSSVKNSVIPTAIGTVIKIFFKINFTATIK